MIKANKILRLTLSAVVGAVSYAASATEEFVLATVDGDPAVTFEDVLYYVGKSERKAKAQFTAAEVGEIIETLVDADILVREAEGRGFAEDERFKKASEAFIRMNLRDMMGRKLLEETAITEEDIRAFYEMGLKWRRVSLLVAKNREQAEAAYRELEKGRPWGDVADEYSICRTAEEKTGSNPVPLIYDGLPAAKAAYETPVGEYTPPVPDNDGIRWDIYRVDKIVHGTTDSYEQGRIGAKAGLENAKLAKRYALFLEEIRPKVAVERNEDLWRDLQLLPFVQFHTKWGTSDEVASNVGVVAVTGKELVFILLDYFTAGPDDIDLLRNTDPEDFAYVSDLLLQKIEGGAFLEVAAKRQGLAESVEFIREYQLFRNGLLTERLIAEGFEATLPHPTEEQAKYYYENHLEEFQVPERVELYVVAMPERGELLDFYEQIIGGADLVDEGEAYNRAQALRLIDSYDPPPTLQPEEEKWLGVVQIYRDPNQTDPDRGFAAELRTRAFPHAPLKRLSDIFLLGDGRWAFYAPIFYQPFRQKRFDEVIDKCKQRVWDEYLQSGEADESSREWLASLRYPHDVYINPELFEEAAVRLNTDK